MATASRVATNPAAHPGPPLPPADLPRWQLPIDEKPTGTLWWRVHKRIYEPLFFFNKTSDSEPVGLIGDSYEYNEDGTVITITIKPDLWMTEASGSRVVDSVLTSVETPRTLEAHRDGHP